MHGLRNFLIAKHYSTHQAKWDKEKNENEFLRHRLEWAFFRVDLTISHACLTIHCIVELGFWAEGSKNNVFSSYVVPVVSKRPAPYRTNFTNFHSFDMEIEQGATNNFGLVDLVDGGICRRVGNKLNALRNSSFSFPWNNSPRDVFALITIKKQLFHPC